jgi:hypothetical protein
MIEKLKNPFRYLPLRQAICWGIVAMILTAVFCWQVGLRMTSITQVNYAGGALWKATVGQLVVWLLFSVILYVVGVMLSRSKIRFWDVASFNLFARIPFNLSLLIFAIPMVRSVMGLAMDGNIARMMEHMNLLTIVGVVSLLFSMWYFYWSYKAFAQLTNLKNGKGVVAFILSFVVAYLVSGYLLKFI